MNLLPDAALAAWRRVSSLVSGMTSAEDSETATAVVALLSALAATLHAEGGAGAFLRGRARSGSRSGNGASRTFFFPGRTRLPFPNGNGNPPTTTIVWTCA